MERDEPGACASGEFADVWRTRWEVASVCRTEVDKRRSRNGFGVPHRTHMPNARISASADVTEASLDSSYLVSFLAQQVDRLTGRLCYTD